MYFIHAVTPSGAKLFWTGSEWTPIRTLARDYPGKGEANEDADLARSTRPDFDVKVRKPAPEIPISEKARKVIERRNRGTI